MIMEGGSRFPSGARQSAPLMIFLLGFALFAVSFMANLTIQSIYLDLLILAGGALVTLSGAIFLHRRHGQGRYLSAQPQLTVVFLMGWWSAFAVPAAISPSFAGSVIEVNILMPPFIMLVALAQMAYGKMAKPGAKTSHEDYGAMPEGPLNPPPQTSTTANALKPIPKLLFVYLLILLAAGFIGAILPMSRSTAVPLYNSLRNQLGTPSAFSIWANNFQIAALGFIPGFGPNFMAMALFNTGQAFDIIGAANGVSGVALFLESMQTPYFWLEYISYTVTPIIGLVPIIAARYHRFKLGILIVAITLVAVAVVLYASAVIEMGYIRAPVSR